MTEHGTGAHPGDRQLLEAVRAATHEEAIPPREPAPDHVALVRRLIAEGADVNAADSDGWTPLHSVAMCDHVELTRVLLDAGARIDAGAHGIPDGTPLAYALFYAQREVAAVVAEAGIVPAGLRTVAALGRVDDVGSFLDGGRPLPDAAADGMGFCGPPWFPPRSTPIDDQLVLDESLTWAARNDQLGAMELLVVSGADVNANPFRGTALLWAIFSDAIDAASWLLDHGADPDLRHDFGGPDHGKAATAMHLAAQYGALRCLRLLLDRGADASIADGAYDSTPLGWARFGEQPDAVALLEAQLGPAS